MPKDSSREGQRWWCKSVGPQWHRQITVSLVRVAYPFDKLSDACFVVYVESDHFLRYSRMFQSAGA